MMSGIAAWAGRADLALMEMQVAALYRHDARGRIVCDNEPDGAPAPRLFLGRTRQGNVWRFRDDLPDELGAALDRRLAREPVAGDLGQLPAGADDLRALLETHAPVESTWIGPAWHFPQEIAPPAGIVAVTPDSRELLRTHFPWTAQEIAAYLPCYVVVRDGVAVALCCSARLTGDAAEAGVHTVAAYRGRGFASAVVAAWARAVRASGRIPLYSTSWDNHASRRVAQRLGLVLYGADLSFA